MSVDFLPSATSAATQSQENLLIIQEIFIISLNIQLAINSNLRTATVNTDTVTMVNGVDVMGSPMTSSDGSSHTYYQVWQGLITDTVKTANMTEVINYFTSYGYSISRKASEGPDSSVNMYWSITW